ncbi:UNVERIFIED_CONTAM: hypothetical protein Sindi_0659400, partial [Sesamum indicum]
EKRLARCYRDAYEPKWEELCELFDDDENGSIPLSNDDEDGDDPLPEIPGMMAPPIE